MKNLYSPIKTKFNFFRPFFLAVLLIIGFSSNIQAQFGSSTCMGATTIKLNMASTNVTLLSGTPGTIGVRYRYTNANVGGTTGIDVIAELIAVQFGTSYNNTVYSLNPDVTGNPPSGTGFGVDGNFQPSFIGNTVAKAHNAGTNDNLFSTWKFDLVLNSNNSTRVYVPIVAQIIDNDGGVGSATSPVIRESVTSITTPTARTLSSASNQTLVGNTVTGPAINQAGIGTSPDFAAYFFYNNVTTFTLRFNHNLVVNTTYTGNTNGTSRYSSAHFGCDYAGNVPFTLVSVRGNVFNDVNGLNGTPANTVDGTGTNVGSQLFATLYDVTNGAAFITVPVNADGTYVFDGVNVGTNYSVYIGNVNTPLGQAAVPTTTLPAGWVNTGENLGTAAGNDGTVNGIIALGVVNANVVNANFGIEQRPTAGSGTNGAVNPGGTTQVTVPANTFSNTTASSDPTLVTSIRITAFPVGATTIVINGTSYTSATFPALGVVVPTDASGNPTQTITVDPAANGATAVTIPFRAIDAAGVESANTGNAVLNLTAISISGNVFNDTNGLLGTPLNTVDGTGVNSLGLNAVLVDNVTGLVVASQAISATGTYSFANQNSGNYSIRITTNAAPAGVAPPAVLLPAGYVSTGENLGAAAGSDGTVNGILNIGAVSTNTTNANFGIEQPPVAGTGANSAVNPGGTTQVTVPANTFSNTTASSDATLVTSIRITAFPVGATTIVINGTSYTSATFPALGVVVPTDASGNPTQTITVDPAANGVTAVTIPFRAIDAAGVESANIGNAVLNLTAIAIGGNVFNDVNGLNGTPLNTVDGALYNTAGLNAVLIDNVTGLVVGTTAVTGGTYNFANQNSGNYSVLITTNAATVGALPPAVALPAGYVSTGENNGAAAGSDGTVNSSINIGAITTTQTQVNFGIEQPPVAGAGANSAVNPGGTTQVTVPANTFSNTTASSDATLVTSIRITAFPVGATTIVINGTSYTSATFPALGVVVPTDASGNPTQTITVDPAANGVTAVTIPFRAIDAAGVESANTGNAVLNLTAIAIGGNVFNDANGLSGTPLNTVDGALYNTAGLNAVLIDNVTGLVVGTTAVTGGTYNFANQNSGNYSVLITTNAATVGALPPAVALPAGYVSTGENNGAAAGSDGTVNSSINIGAITTTQTQVNFGIERLPTSTSQSFTIMTPVGGSTRTLNGLGVAGDPGPLRGSDPEDQPTEGSLSTRSIVINTLPTNGNQLFYNGVQITTTNFSIANYDPALLAVRFTGAGSTSTSFTYSYVDAAGRASASPATYSLDWATVLPVSLISFTATPTGSSVNVGWEVGTEVNVNKYEVLYSTDGIAFTTIGSKTAQGSRTYAFTHQAPAAGVNYYRLKTVDVDGRTSLSEIRKVTIGNNSRVSIYPNPASSIVNLSLSTDLVNKSIKVVVIAADGKIVLQSNIARTAQTETLNVSNLAAGVYVLSIITDDAKVVNTKIQVVR